MSVFRRGDRSTPTGTDTSTPQRELLFAFWEACDRGEMLSRPVDESYIGFNPPVDVKGVSISQTKPDYNWLELFLLGYLDGPPHRKHVRSQRDDAMTSRLERKGYEVMRWPFDRWTVGRKKEILAEVKEIVNRKALEKIK